MPKPKLKVSLLFKADAVVAVTPLDADTEQVIDELLADITISKCRIPCG